MRFVPIKSDDQLDLQSLHRVPGTRIHRWWRCITPVLPNSWRINRAAYFNQRHFAVLAVDARGSGASGGNRTMEWSPAEVADMGEVAAWAAQQPWSNGHVGTFGISYDGNAAELAADASQPAIRAVMPLYDNFDVLWAIQAGGVAQCALLQEWSDVVAAMDRDDVCGADEAKGWDCWKDRLMTSGVRRVDADPHTIQFASVFSGAIEERLYTVVGYANSNVLVHLRPSYREHEIRSIQKKANDLGLMVTLTTAA
jgi:putative CocE/NonD family hydrolase